MQRPPVDQQVLTERHRSNGSRNGSHRIQRHANPRHKHKPSTNPTAQKLGRKQRSRQQNHIIQQHVRNHRFEHHDKSVGKQHVQQHKLHNQCHDGLRSDQRNKHARSRSAPIQHTNTVAKDLHYAFHSFLLFDLHHSPLNCLSKTSISQRNLTADLKKFGLKLISPCHCTGFKATATLWRTYPETFVLNFSGRMIEAVKETKPRVT